MSAKAKAIRTLYRAKRIDMDGVRKAVKDCIISAEEFFMISGVVYEAG